MSDRFRFAPAPASGLDDRPVPVEAQVRRPGLFGRNVFGCVAVIVSVAILAAVGYGGAQLVGLAKGKIAEQLGTPDYTGQGKAPVIVEIKEGATTNKIALLLKRLDVVKSTKAFRNAARDDPRSTKIQTGFYRMKTQLPAKAALALLLDPKNQVTTTVTIPEGWTRAQIVRQLTAKVKVTGPSFEQVAANPKGLRLPAYANGNLEGVLFPATYKFPPNATAQQVLQAMVDRFEQSVKDLDLENKAEAQGLTARQVLILASLVQVESGREADAPKVARVFWNRLDEGRELQSDATVVYAVGRAGAGGPLRTTPTERAVDSRYNTYRYSGLPVGPINNPGDVALKAALDPVQGDWMFFTLVNADTGETAFSVTAEQHEQAVNRFNQWCNASPANQKKCNG